MIFSCSTTDAEEEILHGTIAYPFYGGEAIGNDRSTAGERFVIRTRSGATEYVVEIPHAGRDYDVEVPIARDTDHMEDKFRIKNPSVTDRELVSSMPKLGKATQSERALMDKAFGVGEKGGPKQSPSYSLGLSKIKHLYKKGRNDYALIEINNLLTFYPTSVKLYKMKGTVLMKTRNFKLALRSWQRAAELAPQDVVIQRGIARLKRIMAKQVGDKKQGPTSSAAGQSGNTSSAKGLGSPPVAEAPLSKPST